MSFTDNSLTEIVRLLTANERKECAVFIESPYFSRHMRNHKASDLYALFQYVCKIIQKNQPFIKLEAWDLIYGNKPFAEGTINTLMSSCTALVQRFVALEQARPFEKERQNLHLASFYRERKSERRFLSAIDLLEKQLNDIDIKDHAFYRFSFDFAYEQFLYQSLFNNKTNDINLNSVSSNLDLFYLSAKLELSFQALQQQKLVPFDFNPLIDGLSLIEKIPQTFLSAHPLIHAYTEALLMIKKQNEEAEDHYAKLMLIIEEKSDRFSLKDNKILHGALRNYCTNRYNQGDTDYLSTLLGFYKSHLEKGYLLEQDGLPPAVLQNIVRVSLKLRDYDWCKAFLEKMEFPISGTHRPQEIYHFNLANLMFHLQDFNKSESLLNADYSSSFYQLFNDSRYVIEAHQLDIKLGYEKNLDATFLSDKLKAFRIKVVRKSGVQLSSHHLQAILEFIKVVTKLLQCRTKKQRNKNKIDTALLNSIQELKSEIESQPIVEREWLLDKVAELY